MNEFKLETISRIRRRIETQNLTSMRALSNMCPHKGLRIGRRRRRISSRKSRRRPIKEEKFLDEQLRLKH